MVTRPAAGRRGASNLGCLIWILVLAVVIYYGLGIGEVYWRYFEVVDKMKSAARFAGSESDEQIMAQLRQDIGEIGVPAEAQKFRITRTDNPRGIRIVTQYHETLILPFTTRVVTFTPSIEHRL